MTTPTGPFITPDDENLAQSKSPKAIGQHKINGLLDTFNIDMTDAQIDELVTQVKGVVATYQAWEEFYVDLELRRKRLAGFQAALSQLDLSLAATQLGTSQLALQTFLGGYVTQESAKITQLEGLWATGDLPGYDIFKGTQA